MFFKSIKVLISTSLVALIHVSTVQAITSISHNDVDPISTTLNSIHSTFVPYVRITHGCDYQAAINSAGEVSGGLKASGRSSGSCSSMTGQIYARSTSFSDGTTAIMYAYYFAKDHAFWGGFGGHRHDWENVVVWLDSANTLIGAAYSAHGDYSTTTSPNVSGNHILVDYKTSYTTHSFFESSASSSFSAENLVSYEYLSSTVQSNLAENDWGSAGFPLKDSSFYSYVEESRPFSFPYSP